MLALELIFAQFGITFFFFSPAGLHFVFNCQEGAVCYNFWSPALFELLQFGEVGASGYYNVDDVYLSRFTEHQLYAFLAA